MQAVFTGEFENVIVQSNGVSEIVYTNKEMLACCNIPERGLTELDRLAYVVTQIDSDCFIVPRGSMKKIPLNEIRKNEAFRGLDPE